MEGQRRQAPSRLAKKHELMLSPDGNAEVRRLRLMARPLLTRRRRAHREPPRQQSVVPVLLLLGLIAAVVVAVAVGALDGYSRSQHSLAEPTTLSTPRQSDRPKPEDPLITAARALKPLIDSQPGDRVLYQGKVCVWLRWEGNAANPDLGRPVIKCPTERTLTTDTARLTPIDPTDQP